MSSEVAFALSSEAASTPSIKSPSPFPYLELGSADAAQFDAEAFGTQPQAGAPKPSEQDITERCTQADRAGYERGKMEAANSAETTLADASAKQRARVDETVRQFETEKQRYFQQVEAEVIQLTLAIVRKILGQQAVVDPLLLAGTVRAALDRLGGTSKVTVTVHPATAGKWRQALRNYGHLEFAEDGSLPPEGCILNSQVGTTEINLQQQTQEVEHSFLDLLAQRPAAEARVQ